MFVISAKLTKKKALIAILILAVILAAVIIIAGRHNGGSENASALSAVVKNNKERVEFIRSLGWEIDENPIDEQTVVIPQRFGDVYADYVELQKSQGFNLEDFGGLEVKRYTYEIKNYPTDDTSVVLDLLVYRNRVIGGDVQSTSIDGFMHGLSYPEAENN